MKRTTILVIVSGVSLVLASCVLTLACGAGAEAGGARTVSFAADQVVTTRGGRRIVSRCFFAPERVRIEMRMSHARGGSLITIGRQDLGKAWILFPAMRRYQEISLAKVSGGRLFLKPSPEEIVERLGFERVEGYRCEKMRVRHRGEGAHGPVEVVVTVWMARDFPVPLRTVSADGTVTEYHKIVMGPQPAALFELPAGYTKMAGGIPLSGGR
ncbi:MAG: DUF4412 domain-containing protein [Acidobacteria bacterium]|nr:DUF4412 domain-containing protein [Acidobacteriota bacterium]